MVSITLAFAEGGGSIISPDGSLFFILFLFIIFVFLLNRVLFRPIGRVLDERQILTEGAANEARAARRRYEAKLAEYEATIRHARAEGYKRSEQARAVALEERRRLIEEAKLHANQQIERAKLEIAEQVARARVALGSEARQIAERISRAVLGRAVGGAD